MKDYAFRTSFEFGEAIDKRLHKQKSELKTNKKIRNEDEIKKEKNYHE